MSSVSSMSDSDVPGALSPAAQSKVPYLEGAVGGCITAADPDCSCWPLRWFWNRENSWSAATAASIHCFIWQISVCLGSLLKLKFMHTYDSAGCEGATCSCINEIGMTGRSSIRCWMQCVGSLGKVFQDMNLTGQNMLQDTWTVQL